MIVFITLILANMSPNARNRYFQELLKTSGASMSDEMRRSLIEAMMANAQNLSEEDRENMLKDLMTNLVNFLPAELAQKVLADIMKVLFKVNNINVLPIIYNNNN